MNLLITGTDGCIGSSLKEYFTAHEFSVTGTVFMRPPMPGEYRVDVRNQKDINALPKKIFPVIIHTAGIVDQSLPAKLIRAVNACGTMNMLGWAKDHGCVHFIQMSSVSVYGLRTMGENRTEHMTKRYNGLFTLPYMRSKSMAERYIEESGIGYTLLRLPAVLGRNDAYLSPAIITQLLNGSFSFCGNGNKLISVICVKNLGPILHKVIDIGPQNDYFHCTDHEIPWREFVSEYARHLNLPVPQKKRSILTLLTHLKDKKYLLMITFSRFGAHYSNSKIKSRIHFETPFHWREEVRDAVDSYVQSSGK